jgi:hypothetical protein
VQTDPSSAPPEETAEDLLRRLRTLVGDGGVEIAIDPRRLNHMDSPVVVEADSNIWLYGLLAASGVVWWMAGMTVGLGAFATSVALYATAGRRYVRQRIERRVHAVVLYDVTAWRRLWRFGGIALSARQGTSVRRCAAPADNWMAFVRDITSSTAAR